MVFACQKGLMILSALVKNQAALQIGRSDIRMETEGGMFQSLIIE